MTILPRNVNAIENTINYTNIKVDDQSETIKAVEPISSWMPDTNLQAIVAKEVGKEVADLTQQDMVNLRSLSFNTLPINSQVDLTGLEYAVNLNKLDTTNIIASKIPTITLTNNATLFTRPNVLRHIIASGNFSNIHIGSYQDGLYFPTSELSGVGKSLTGWKTDYLTIYSTNLTDFSVLEIPDTIQENSYLAFLSNQYDFMQPLMLAPLQIQGENFENITYSDVILKDTAGKPMLSTQSNSSDFPYLDALDENDHMTPLEVGIDYHFTETGIEFIKIPQNTKYIDVSFALPAFFALDNRVSSQINYSINARIPLEVSITAQNVTIKYLDEAGNTVHDAQIISGYIGNSFDATTDQYKLAIDGYTLDELKLPINGTGILSDQAQTVIYTYKQNPVKAAPIIVQYLDTNGNKLDKSVILNGNIGESYKTENRSFPGYIFKKVIGNPTGFFTNETQEVSYIYEKEEVSVTFPSSEPPHNSTANQEIENSKAEAVPKLPTTAETANNHFIRNGIMLLFISFFIFSYRKDHSKKSNR